MYALQFTVFWLLEFHKHGVEGLLDTGHLTLLLRI